MSKLRLSDLDRLLSSRPVNRQAGAITSGGSPVDNTIYPQPRRAANRIEPPRRQFDDRHTAMREQLAQRRAELEAMDADMLELEITTLRQNLERVKADLADAYAMAREDPIGTRDRLPVGWRVRAERAAAAIRAEVTLADSEQRKRAQRRIEAEHVASATEREERRVAHERTVAAQMAKTRERIEATDFAHLFFNQARELLEPETFNLLLEATRLAMAKGRKPQ